MGHIDDRVAKLQEELAEAQANCKEFCESVAEKDCDLQDKLDTANTKAKEWENHYRSLNEYSKTEINAANKRIEKYKKLVNHEGLNIGCYYGCKAQGGKEQNCHVCQIIEALRALEEVRDA